MHKKFEEYSSQIFIFFRSIHFLTHGSNFFHFQIKRAELLGTYALL